MCLWTWTDNNGGSSHFKGPRLFICTHALYGYVNSMRNLLVDSWRCERCDRPEQATYHNVTSYVTAELCYAGWRCDRCDRAGISFSIHFYWKSTPLQRGHHDSSRSWCVHIKKQFHRYVYKVIFSYKIFVAKHYTKY